MTIPPGKTEAEVLAAIEKAANILAPSFVFGHYHIDDIRQQCFVYAIEVLAKEKYDTSRPLENFLYTHLRNRLINLRRNQFRRNDPPCPACHAGTPCQDGCCEKYRSWLERNQAKANLANPLALEHVNEDRGARTSSTVETEAEINELLEIIDKQLPVELRGTYLQMRAGVSVHKGKRLQVENAVKEILKGAIEVCPSEDD